MVRETHEEAASARESSHGAACDDLMQKIKAEKDEKKKKDLERKLASIQQTVQPLGDGGYQVSRVADAA